MTPAPATVVSKTETPAPLIVTLRGLPPTANARMGTTKTGKRYLKPAAKRWKRVAAWDAVLSRGRRPVLTEPVTATITFYMDPTRRRDADAGVKDTLDALTGTVWKDDRLVRSFEARLERVGTRGEERTVVVVEVCCG